MNDIDHHLSRRQILMSLGVAGVAVAAAGELSPPEATPFVLRPGEQQANLPTWIKVVRGNGARLLIEQLKAAQCTYLFVNPSSGQAPLYDCLIDEPSLHPIEALHEGSLAAMADGYARATRTVAFVTLARAGVPNAMTQMFNAWKDHIPMVVLADDVATAMRARDSFEAMDHMTSITAPMVKWHWTMETAARIPEVMRRATKYAVTSPRAPVFVACPEDLLRQEAEAAVVEQGRYQVSTRVRPDSEIVRHVAGLIVEANNPLIYAGDDVRQSQAEGELLELAELLGIPVVNDMTVWSRPFPTHHPLYLGRYQPTARVPGKVDLILHLGSRFSGYFGGHAFQMESQVKLVEIGLDAAGLARTYPVEAAVVADPKLALLDLLEEVRSRITPRKQRAAGTDRLNRAKAYQRQRTETLDLVKRARWNNQPISGERLVAELETWLEAGTVVVSENDTFEALIETGISFGPQAKEFFSNAGYALGWGLGAAFGIKLAMPDRKVVALVSDGAFLFSGPQPLWSYSRYRAPVAIVVLNNRSYNAERNRIMTPRGRGYETGRDLVCNLGDPEVEYVRSAQAFGVEGESVDDPAKLREALARVDRSITEGKPYLLEVRMEQTGSLANSSWHPTFTFGSLRK